MGGGSSSEKAALRHHESPEIFKEPGLPEWPRPPARLPARPANPVIGHAQDDYFKKINYAFV
jgi:hypothetical protein